MALGPDEGKTEKSIRTRRPPSNGLGANRWFSQPSNFWKTREFQKEDKRVNLANSFYIFYWSLLFCLFMVYFYVSS